MSLELQPISFEEAKTFIAKHHRHHIPPQGWKFGIAINDGNEIVGVAMVGRPIARRLDDGWTLELTRLCIKPDVKNGASKLLGAVQRAAFALGYKKVITYTLATEPGTSLIAANWKLIGANKGGSWSVPSRPRVDKHPITPKLKWETAA